MNNYSEEFEKFWKEYPKRGTDNKFNAWKAFEKAIKITDIDTILKSVKDYKNYPEVKKGYNKLASSYLNQRQWETIKEIVPFEMNFGKESSEQVNKVYNNVIKPLIEYYGEPNFFDKGKNANTIIAKWAGALSHFSLIAMRKGVEYLIETKETTYFPTLPQTIEAVKKYYLETDTTNKEGHKAIEWYNSIFIENNQNYNNYIACHHALKGILDDAVKVLKLKNIEISFTNLLKEAWESTDVRYEFESRVKEYNEIMIKKDSYAKGRQMVKDLYLKMKGRN